MKDRNKIIFLTVFLLVVFFTPLVVKVLHHHAFSFHYAETNGITISNLHNGHCAICEYKFFISDIPFIQEAYLLCFLFIQYIFLPLQDGFRAELSNKIAPRAPPVII